MIFSVQANLCFAYSFFFLWQSKEKLINSLKEGSGFEGPDSSTANSVELEELRHEKETQREEIQKLMGQIHQLRSELQVRVVTVQLHRQPFTSGY